jgi:hypothetical protein
MSWSEALQRIRELNNEEYLGFSDWRLPNRRELRSLVNHGASRPALSKGNPFSDIVQTWYWTSTSSAMYPAYAWYVNFEGGRMFWGAKNRDYLVWPVCGKTHILPQTGEGTCFDRDGQAMDCKDSGTDGELRMGVPWPEKRFEEQDEGIWDRLTGLYWSKHAFLGESSWDDALHLVDRLRHQTGQAWHLPNINELESLVDASRASPALPAGHPFSHVQEVYWSSTSSGYETDWSFALYMHKGAVGVGRKDSHFAVWPALSL